MAIFAMISAGFIGGFLAGGWFVICWISRPEFVRKFRERLDETRPR